MAPGAMALALALGGQSPSVRRTLSALGQREDTEFTHRLYAPRKAAVSEDLGFLELHACAPQGQEEAHR